MIGFVFLFCLLFRWGILHRVLLVVGWCWVLYSSGFLCGSSHYLILPKVSYLVGSWSQCSNSNCFQLFVTLWTVAHQVLLSVECSRQEYGSRLPCPPPRDLPDPGIRPASPASPALAGRLFATEPLGKSTLYSTLCQMVMSPMEKNNLRAAGNSPRFLLCTLWWYPQVGKTN